MHCQKFARELPVDKVKQAIGFVFPTVIQTKFLRPCDSCHLDVDPGRSDGSSGNLLHYGIIIPALHAEAVSRLHHASCTANTQQMNTVSRLDRGAYRQLLPVRDPPGGPFGYF